MPHFSIGLRSLTGAFLAIGVAANAAPQNSSIRVLDYLATCRTIASDAERLDCFDRAAATIVGDRQSGKLMAFDRDIVKAERRTHFGLVDPPSNAGMRAAEAATVKTLSSTITSVAPGRGPGRWRMTLANGQVWQMLGTSRIEPRKGAMVRLGMTVTGGIRASIDGRPPVQVKRTR